MQQESIDNSPSAGDEYRFNLRRGHLAVLVAASLLAALVYWLILPQVALIAGALTVTIFAAVLWMTEALPLPVSAILIPVGLAADGRSCESSRMNAGLLIGKFCDKRRPFLDIRAVEHRVVARTCLSCHFGACRCCSGLAYIPGS